MSKLYTSSLKIAMLWSFLSATNRVSVRLVARALVSSNQPYQFSRLTAANLAASSRSYGKQTTTTRLGVSVEEDLDAALDDILENPVRGGTSSSNNRRNPRKVTSISNDESFFGSIDDQSEHPKGSRPISPSLLEEDDPVDWKDPEILNTSNPRWIQAGLSPAVINVLSEKGITHLTSVQAEAFSPVLAGRDVIGRSRTGTGKTLAFGMPALTRLIEFAEQKGNRNAQNGRMQRGRKVAMLVLCPTRELARQVQEELAQIARPLGLFTTVFHGGVSYDPQVRSLNQGVDVLVGTPGRVIDHLERGTLDLSECDVVVLDEADEMLNMGFADDVEVILQDLGSANDNKPQCLLFSATTPPWVKEIGQQYQKDVLSIDSTTKEGGGARVAKTVRHCAVQLPPGIDAKKAVLEDIIAVEISRDKSDDDKEGDTDDEMNNPIAAAAKAKKDKSAHAMQQKIFGKTIVFTQTKKDADEMVSTGVFKSLTAQAIHGDVGQKQRDATLNAFRQGAFNVLVATDVAARGIDIQDVDLVVQLDPPRDADTYVHRSGRTGRAGKKGVSVLLFGHNQARDIVNIERSLGHGFKFDLVGPPSTEAALRAAAKTSAIACMTIPDETAAYFKEAATELLEQQAEEGGNPEDIVARCLAAISRRSTEVQSRSLITGELGMATVEMAYEREGRFVKPGDVMFTVGKLSRMSQRDGDLTFDSDVGKINVEDNTAVFDMGVEDAKKLVEFSKDIDAGGAVFSILHELEVKRDRFFGRDRRMNNRNGGGRGRDFGGGGGGGRNYSNNDRFNRGNRKPYNAASRPHFGGGGGGGGVGNNRRRNNEFDGGYRGGRGRDYGRGGGGNSGGGQRRYDNNRRSNNYNNSNGW